MCDVRRYAVIVMLAVLGSGPASLFALPVLSTPTPQAARSIALVGLRLGASPAGSGTSCAYTHVPTSDLKGSSATTELVRNGQVVQQSSPATAACALVRPGGSDNVEFAGTGVLGIDISLPAGDFNWRRATTTSRSSAALSDLMFGTDLVSADANGSWFSVHVPATASDPAENAVAQQAAASVVTGPLPGRFESTAEAVASQRIELAAGAFILEPDIGAIDLDNGTTRGHASVYFQGQLESYPGNPTWTLFAEALPGMPAVAEHPEQWLNVEFKSTIASLDKAAITARVVDGLVRGASAGEFHLLGSLSLFKIELRSDSAFAYRQSATAYANFVPEPTSMALFGIGVAGLVLSRRLCRCACARSVRRRG